MTNVDGKYQSSYRAVKAVKAQKKEPYSDVCHLSRKCIPDKRREVHRREAIHPGELDASWASSTLDYPQTMPKTHLFEGGERRFSRCRGRRESIS
ncbi:hypothetical protein K0M31_008660 [Melipona bicolor]|uniref:Uncharacterized protein n=1 Tax=Melipona bicolor TaxID=60889 RepID=A0AA40FPM0_9HYME|nr:hypothetical protein K0M31_008660 [Melipona bicolor]